jgi:hypothetical protein
MPSMQCTILARVSPRGRTGQITVLIIAVPVYMGAPSKKETIIATEMTAVTLDVCMAKLEDASDQMAQASR